MKTQKIETYKPITIDGLGVINVKDHGFTLTHENGITDFSYKDYLGDLYHTREDEIENYVKAESVDESEETFDIEKAIKEAEKSIQPADIIELNRRTAYDLLETDPDEVVDFCQSRMLKCA